MVRRKPSPRTNVLHNRDRTRIYVDKKKRKNLVLQQIRRLRRSTHLLIPKLCFARVVRDIIFEVSHFPDSLRIQGSALEALQEAAEMYIVQFFEDSMLLALHAKRVTLMRQDMVLMRRLRGRADVINK